MPDFELLPALFTAAARRSPEAVAVRDGHHRLSYADLDRRAGALSAVLAASGTGRGHLVAVVLDRSADLVVTLLGVLRAGAAYLPISPGDPAERLRFLLDDARPSLVLTTTAQAARLTWLDP